MKISQAAVFEAKKAERSRIVLGLQKAGLKVTRAEGPEALKKEGLVVVGASAQKLAKAIRKMAPNALVLAAVKKPGKAPRWADGVLPLPVSAPDLRVRLPELVRLRELALRPPVALVQAAAAHEREPEPPAMRPGEGILDPLTGFYTFAHFKEVLFVEVKRARRYNFALSLGLIEFDPLPGPVSDDTRAKLQAGLALSIRRSLRDTDYPVQYSGDRVLLLMPHTDLQGALVVSRRICERVARATLQDGEQVLRPTISSGVAASSNPSREFSFAELVKHAQLALDRARGAGGNRVEFSTPDPSEFVTETHPVIAAQGE